MKLFGIDKASCEKILRGFYAKYEKKYQGIFVATYLENETIQTITLLSTELIGLSGKQVIGLYLIAVRSPKHADVPVRYADLAFAETAAVQSNKEGWKSTVDAPKILSNSDAVNNPLKRSAPTVEGTENMGESISKQTSKLLSDSFAIKAMSSQIAPQLAQKATQPSKNLMNFFGKK